jgi:apolipoprotein N-acyltransferase
MAGGILAMGHPPLSLPWIAVLGLCAGIWLIAAAQGPRAGFWRGWAFGLGHFAGSLFWIVEPFLVDAARHGWMAPFALLLLAGGLALFWGAAGTVAVRLASERSGRAILFALGLVAAEAVRAHILTGFPWASIGHIWALAPQAQMAALTGPAGLTLLTCIAAALPAAFGVQRAALSAMLGAALLSLPAGYGLVRLGLAAPPDPDAPMVRLVQPNAAQHLKWKPDHIEIFLNRALDLTAERDPGEAPPALVVWPETSIPYPLGYAGDVLAEIAAASDGAPVAAGMHRWDETDGTGRNALVVIGAGGQPRDIYDKHHLVPFGEYIPLAHLLPWLGLTGLAERAGGYGAGPGPRLVDLGAGLGRALPLICYEAIFPEDVRAAPERPAMLLLITNDAWFGALAGPQQHLAQARLRAIEQGLPMLRAANTGISAVIDAHGRVIAALPLAVAGRLDAPLPAALPPTPYVIWGGWPISALWIVLVTLSLTFMRKKADTLDAPPPRA